MEDEPDHIDEPGIINNSILELVCVTSQFRNVINSPLYKLKRKYMAFIPTSLTKTLIMIVLKLKLMKTVSTNITIVISLLFQLLPHFNLLLKPCLS